MASSPIEVGTRGTIASLVSQEIDHFRKLNLEKQVSSQRPKAPAKGGTTNGSSSKTGQKKKKGKKKSKVKGRRKSGGFLPGICSLVQISEKSGVGERVPRVGYSTLRADGKRFSSASEHQL